MWLLHRYGEGKKTVERNEEEYCAELCETWFRSRCQDLIMIQIVEPE
jgi:hypothetical protein